MSIPAEDLAALKKHGWRQLTENIPGTRQRRPIDQFVIEDVATMMRKGPRWQVYRHARDWLRGVASATLMDDPVALSTYFLMRGDGDVLRGIDLDIEEDWNP